MAADSIRMGDAQALRIVDSTPAALEVKSTWQSGGAIPRTHWHPRQTEWFEVLEGELTVRIGTEPARVVPAGESFEVPPRTAHAMWNAGSDVCRATWRITPAQRTEEMFRTIDSRPGPLRQVAMLWRFRNEFRLGSPQ